MKPKFRIERRGRVWAVDVFWITDNQQALFSDWEGFEEPFDEATYQMMSEWCQKTFKTWLWPKRARRMSFTQFWFKDKKDLDWFILYWSGVDISVD